MGYTKLFSSLLASSVWQEDLATKVMWVTMLAMRNERNVVEGSVVGLAHLAGVSVEQAEEAIRKFEAPDPHSSNPANGGRKIERITGGWLLLNGEYYQKKMSLDERREYLRVKQREYRMRKKGGSAKTAVENAAEYYERIGDEAGADRTREIEQARVENLGRNGEG